MDVDVIMKDILQDMRPKTVIDLIEDPELQAAAWNHIRQYRPALFYTSLSEQMLNDPDLIAEIQVSSIDEAFQALTEETFKDAFARALQDPEYYAQMKDYLSRKLTHINFEKDFAEEVLSGKYSEGIQELLNE